MLARPVRPVLAEGGKGDAKVKDGPAAYTISGPFTHDNLTIFLLHGKDTLSGKPLLTLQEALEQKKAVVHEPAQVNELSIENVSSDVEIYVQPGDIVKGGRQDRLIAYDLILPPKSGKVPVASFCVEAGRWAKRGGEADAYFGSSGNVANSKDLKVAAQSGMRQPERGLGQGTNLCDCTVRIDNVAVSLGLFYNARQTLSTASTSFGDSSSWKILTSSAA